MKLAMDRAMLRLWIVMVCACAQGGAGAPCSRKSDCASGVCRPNGTCSNPIDAGVDAEVDAFTTKLPDYPPDAEIDAN